jgi:peptide/nickel transport system permease protein
MKTLRRLWHTPSARPALLLAAFILLSAALADFLASDLPLAVKVDGRVWLIPCLTRPAALRGETQQSLSRRADWIAQTLIPYGPTQTWSGSGEVHGGPPPWPPDSRHWLGTDEIGRDVTARLLHGGRISLSIALLSVAAAVGVGVLIGGIAGYWGGSVDLVLSRFIEVMMTLPTVFLLLTVLAVFRSDALMPLILALGLTRWTSVARLMRAEVMKTKTLGYIEAAKAIGASPLRIFRRHLWPNTRGPVMVAAVFGVGSTLLLESSLSFLGVGVPAPYASWGEILAQAHRNLVTPGAWWLALFPGLAIGLTLIATNGIAGALRGHELGSGQTNLHERKQQ